MDTRSQATNRQPDVNIRVSCETKRREPLRDASSAMAFDADSHSGTFLRPKSLEQRHLVVAAHYTTAPEGE